MINKDLKISVANFCKGAVIALSAAAVLAVAPLANAEFVVNGGFEQVNDMSNNPVATPVSGQISYSLLSPGWSAASPNGSYAFIFTPGSADTTGAYSQFSIPNDGGNRDVSLWGPNNGGADTNVPLDSPDGGNFLASDGAFNTGPVTQTLTGLTDGHQYTVSFDWAAAQQYGFPTDNSTTTTSGWAVSLGDSGVQNVSATIILHGFSGWSNAQMEFTADSSSEVLSFLATGGPGSQAPPFALLDGVSVTDTTTTDVPSAPEPGTWLLMLTGILGALAVSRSRQWMKR